jgi:hypothetical protein
MPASSQDSPPSPKPTERPSTCFDSARAITSPVSMIRRTAGPHRGWVPPLRGGNGAHQTTSGSSWVELDAHVFEVESSLLGLIEKSNDRYRSCARLAPIRLHWDQRPVTSARSRFSCACCSSPRQRSIPEPCRSTNEIRHHALTPRSPARPDRRGERIWRPAGHPADRYQRAL